MTCVKIGNGIIYLEKEVSDLNVDLRTRQGREFEVLEQVRQFGGFPVFWATENQKRAHAIDRVSGSGQIVRQQGDLFPWCSYMLEETAL